MENQNKNIYSTSELDNWRKRADQDLISIERYLIEKYLTDKSRNVIEAGTGGGRIVFNIEKLGFKEIYGFDYVPGMVEYARQTASAINSGAHFFQGDAVELSMIKDNQFFYSIYLQQVISFIPYELIQKALNESYRITAPGGTVIFSFLYFNGKKRNKFLSPVITILRSLRGEKLKPQQLPWMLINHKFNWSFFRKNQPVNYWFKRDEILSMLSKAGFRKIEAKTSGEILNLKNKEEGMLYVVCGK